MLPHKNFLNDEHESPEFLSINDSNDYTLGSCFKHMFEISPRHVGLGFLARERVFWQQ